MFRSDLFDEDHGQFIRLWLNLIGRYPFTAFEAFLNNNYGYWFPDVELWIYPITTTKPIEEIRWQPLVNLPWIEWLSNVMKEQTHRLLPFGYLLTSRGFCFWIWLFCGMYCLYNNRRRFPLFMIGFFIWAPILFSAVYAMFRYVYGLFTCLPLLTVSALSARGHES